MRSACTSGVVQSSSPTDAQRRDARDMAQRARQSAILGDATASLSQLRGAAGLDPTDPNLAYELARAYESAGARRTRRPSIADFSRSRPTPSRRRTCARTWRRIAPPRPDTVVTIEGTAFKRGVDAYEQGTVGRRRGVLHHGATDRLHVRGHVLRSRRWCGRCGTIATTPPKTTSAICGIRPEAADRAVVVARVNALRAQRLSASQAFGLGVVVPGGGQFYARRPIRGILSLAAVGAAAGFAMMEKTTTSTTTQTASDPFGNKYSYSFPTTHKTRPYMIPGFAAAGGIALLSAIDAARYAGSVRGSSVSVSLVPGPNGVGGLVSFAIP